MKNYIKTIVLVLILVLNLTIIVNAESVHSNFKEDIISEKVILGESSINDQLIISNGDRYGVVDFDFRNNKIFVLNNANNNLYSIFDGYARKLIHLSDMDARMLSLNDNNNFAWVWGYVEGISSLKMVELLSGYQVNFDIPVEIDEAIMSLYTIDNMIYLTVSEENGIVTYELIPDSKNELKVNRKIEGQVVDNNLSYFEKATDINKYSRQLIINEFNTNRVDSIIIRSRLPILTMQLLGKYDENYIVKLYECSNHDNEDMIIESIIIVNPFGEILGSVLANNDKNAAMNMQSFKFHNGRIIDYRATSRGESSMYLYQLPFNRDRGSIYDEYVMEHLESQNMNKLSAKYYNEGEHRHYLSGDDIINIAKTYHSPFNWYCSQSNLNPLTGWYKPAHLTNIDTWYTMMPYARARWNTPGDFINRMENGERAGHTGGSQLYDTAGIDCSGLVSRAWQLSSHTSTRNLPNVATQIQYTNLQKGDILNKYNSHVIIFESIQNGIVTCYESTYNSQWGRVAHTTKYLSSLTTIDYKAYRR